MEHLEREDLVRQIERAFPEEPVPQGTIAYPPEDMDALWYEQMCLGKTWRQVELARDEQRASAIGFLVGPAFAYYLPHYLVAVVEDATPEGFGEADPGWRRLIMWLSPYATYDWPEEPSNMPWALRQAETLSPEQRRVVAEFLRYVAAVMEYPAPEDAIDEGDATAMLSALWGRWLDPARPDGGASE